MENHFEISVFNGIQTEQKQLQCVGRIKSSFPNLGTEFYNVLLERVRDLKISDDRLVASVKNVIDNCEYPTPTIAQFIKFDKKIKLYNFVQMQKLNNELSGKGFNHYSSIKVGWSEKPMWASNNDIEQYNLTRFQAK